MSQAGVISNSGGGGGGINTVAPGLGISVSTVGSTATVTNIGTIQYVSPVIDFKVVQNITLFTTISTKSFVPSGLFFIIDVNNAANGDGTFSIGFTDPTFSDLYGASPFNLPGSNNDFTFFAPVGSLQPTTVPSNTAVIYSCTAGDTGTALSGRIVLQGFYA